MKKDTIAAISTGMTNSGIGIVRISGDEAFHVIDKIYRGKDQLREALSLIHISLMLPQRAECQSVFSPDWKVRLIY